MRPQIAVERKGILAGIRIFLQARFPTQNGQRQQARDFVQAI